MAVVPDEKIEAVDARYRTLQQQMTTTAGGGQEYVKISREYAELGPVVQAIETLRKARGDVTDAEQMLKDPSLDAFGEVIWHKPLSPQDRFYPAGFSTRRHLFGNLYTPMGGAAVRGDQRVGGMLSGGNMEKVILGDAGPPAVAGASLYQVLQHFTWNFRPDTGYVEGTFIHPATKQETAFRGALLQKRGWTSG